MKRLELLCKTSRRTSDSPGGENPLEFLQAKEFVHEAIAGGQRLKLESQKQIQKKRHAYQDLIRGLIEEGIREGAFRKTDPLLAARC